LKPQRVKVIDEQSLNLIQALLDAFEPAKTYARVGSMAKVERACRYKRQEAPLTGRCPNK
jgi:hypothetical protein